MTKHKFGGPWTRLKLAILRDYLGFFTRALGKTPFNLYYADAFAGTGKQSFDDESGQGAFFEHEDMEGSARIALNIEPAFDGYYFNDLAKPHYEALKELLKEYPEKEPITRITNLDGNDFVKRFCASLRSNDRAILFIDPYNTELNWETLTYVAGSNRIDLWLLFPISALLRMTPTDSERLDPALVKTIDRLLGTDKWQEALYKPKPEPVHDDLFGEVENEGMERLNVQEVSDFVKSRLEEQFAYVAKPVTLYNNGRPLFLFMFAVSNSSRTAQKLAEKVSTQILRKHQNAR